VVVVMGACRPSPNVPVIQTAPVGGTGEQQVRPALHHFVCRCSSAIKCYDGTKLRGRHGFAWLCDIIRVGQNHTCIGTCGVQPREAGTLG